MRAGDDKEQDQAAVPVEGMESGPSVETVPDVRVLVQGGMSTGGMHGRCEVTTIYFQVEFYSQLEQRWVALFAREKTAQEAETKRGEWLAGAMSRVVKVTQTTEVITGEAFEKR